MGFVKNGFWGDVDFDLESLERKWKDNPSPSTHLLHLLMEEFWLKFQILNNDEKVGYLNNKSQFGRNDWHFVLVYDNGSKTFYVPSIRKIHNGRVVGKGDFAVWDDTIHLVKEKTG